MKKIIMFFFACIALYGADATISIVNQGVVHPKIMVQDATTSVDSELKTKFFKLIVGDLKVSSNFEVIDTYNTSSYDGDFKTNMMSEQNPEIIVRYELSGNVNQSLSLKVKIINAKSATVRYEKIYDLTQGARYPFLAHRAIVELIKNLSLPPVDWMEKAIIISKYTGVKNSQIIIADYTLTYQKVIVSGGLNVFPKWANKDQNAFYYTTYSSIRPTLMKLDLLTGQKTKILDSNGMLIASDVSQDGNKLLLTMAPKDQSDIYIYDLRTRQLQQVTFYSGIDVNGNFVENDTKVVFVSDRLGYPNIFLKPIEGRSVEQMVFQGKNNNSISAYKNYIVYSSREEGNEFGSTTFNLYLISTDTDYIRQLTSNGKNLYPRFSSDGESIVFIKELGSQSALGILRVKENKSFNFPLRVGRIQSIDW